MSLEAEKSPVIQWNAPCFHTWQNVELRCQTDCFWVTIHHLSQWGSHTVVTEWPGPYRFSMTCWQKFAMALSDLIALEVAGWLLETQLQLLAQFKVPRLTLSKWRAAMKRWSSMRGTWSPCLNLHSCQGMHRWNLSMKSMMLAQKLLAAICHVVRVLNLPLSRKETKRFLRQLLRRGTRCGSIPSQKFCTW